MSSTGYGRISSANRISYYKGSTSRGRTYRGVRTGKMTADISNRLAKAQDTSMKNQYNDGLLSADQYNAYLSQRIAQTSDPTYRGTLTQELQNVVTGTNEASMLDGYKAGNVSAAQVASYYQSKLQGLTPDNPLYSKTQADIVKWNNTATTDSYKAQEAVLKSQESGAADQLPAAQKLLDFYVQYLQKLSPGNPDYNSTVQAIGTYQKKVRDLTFQQSLLKAEDKISQTYNKNTPEDWNAKAQMYQQLRDAAAQQGDTTNFYKYDQLANNATDAATKAQATQNTKVVSDAIKQVRENYISGKIDGSTAQQQLMEIGTYADQNSDVSGSLLVHDLYNTIQSNIDHGVTYGGDNGYGKTKGGTGGSSQWFDAATNSPISGSSTSTSGSSGASSGASSSTSSQASPSTSAGASNSNSTETSTSSADLLSKLSNATQIANIQSNQTMMNGISNIAHGGGTFADMVLFLRMQKVGTGDGWKALKDYQQQRSQQLSQEVESGQITPQQYKQAEVQDLQGQLALYASWQQLATTDPNYKVNIDGKATRVGTLTTQINNTINGHETIDPASGMAVKDKPGITDIITMMQNPTYQPLFVQDKNNPSQLLTQAEAIKLLNDGSLSKSYVQVNGQYFFVNGSHQIGGSFSTKADAASYAKSQGISNPVMSQNSDGTFKIMSGPPTQGTITMTGPGGQVIKYTLNNGVPTGLEVNGVATKGYLPSQVMSPTATINGVNNFIQTYKENNPTLNTSKVANAADVSKVAGFSTPRANMSPANASSATLANNLPTNQPGTFNLKSLNSLTPSNPFAPELNTASNFLRGGAAGVINPGAANINSPLLLNPAVDNILSPVFNQVARPVDQLIQNIFKPSQVIKPVAIPQDTPLNLNQSQQQTFSSPVTSQQPAGANPVPQQQNPASPAAPLQNVGSQPQTPLQQSGLHVNLGSFPSTNQQPAPAQNNWVSNIGNALGGAAKTVENTAGNLWNSASSAMGGFFSHF